MKNQIDKLFILAYSLVQFVYPFGSIDAVNTQFVYLSSITLFTSIYLMSRQSNLLNWRNLTGEGIIFQTLFITLALISIFTAFNKIESFVALSRYIQLFLFLFNISILFKRCDFKLKDLSLIFTFLVLGDIAIFLVSLAMTFDFSSPSIGSRALMGFTSNSNVLAFSSLARMYIIFYLYLTTTKKTTFFFSTVVLSLIVYMILTSGSRGALIALIITFLVLTLLIIFYQKKYFKRIVIITIVFFGTFVSHELININSSSNTVQNVTSFSLQGQTSTNERLQWYSNAIDGIIDAPLFGHGIGNWKILADKYAGDYIKEYTVPYHAHNDFFHISAEIGILGGIIYFLFYVYILILCYKNYLDGRNKLAPILIGLSILSFLMDSMINFPRARAISMVNILFISALYINPKFSSKSHKQYSFFVIYFCFALITFYSLFKVFDSASKESYLEGVVPHSVDFNKINLDDINRIDHNFPNIDKSTFPLVSIKGIVYWKKGNLEAGKKMIRSGLKMNPYLGFIESNLAEIYLEEGKIDSSYYMAKKAFKILPNNTRHINVLQGTLIAKKDTIELNQLFEKVKYKNREEIWQNHVMALSRLKLKDGFNSSDKRISQTAQLKFPNNKIIRGAHKVIHLGADKIAYSNFLAEKGKKAFEEKNYKIAESYFNDAKKVVPVETSHYLNLAQIYTLNGEFKKSINELEEIRENGIQINDGKLEFLMALNYISTNENDKSCLYLKRAYNKGYNRNGVLSLINKLRCF